MAKSSASLCIKDQDVKALWGWVLYSTHILSSKSYLMFLMKTKWSSYLLLASGTHTHTGWIPVFILWCFFKKNHNTVLETIVHKLSVTCLLFLKTKPTEWRWVCLIMALGSFIRQYTWPLTTGIPPLPVSPPSGPHSYHTHSQNQSLYLECCSP